MLPQCSDSSQEPTDVWRPKQVTNSAININSPVIPTGCRSGTGGSQSILVLVISLFKYTDAHQLWMSRGSVGVEIKIGLQLFRTWTRHCLVYLPQQSGSFTVNIACNSTMWESRIELHRHLVFFPHYWLQVLMKFSRTELLLFKTLMHISCE